MNDSEIFERIKKIVRDEYANGEKSDSELFVQLHSNLEEDLHLDSLDRIELWLLIEDDFKICIDTEEAKQIKTVQDCIDCIKKYSKE